MPTVVAIAGLVLTLTLAEEIGAAIETAHATIGPPSACPAVAPTVDDAVDPLTRREAEEAAPRTAVAPASRSFDHRTLTPLRPSLRRARGGGWLELTGSRATGTVVAAPAGGVQLDDLLCMVPTRTTSAETAAGIVGGDSALRANSAPDTDTIVRPTANGVTVVESRRGLEAPTSFEWSVGLPSGASLRRLADDAVAIENDEGRVAGVVTASADAGEGGGSAPAPDRDDEAQTRLTPSAPDELTLASPPDADAVAVTVAAKGHRHHKHKRKPPGRVKAYPLVGISGNLSTEAANAACSFARSQPKGKRLLLLNFGQAHVEGETGAFGAGRRPFNSNDDILAALNAAAHRYRRAACHRPHRRATIAYGVGNYKLSTTGDGGHPMSRQLAGRVGRAQLHVARRIKHRAKDSAAVAGDLEPPWDPGRTGVALAKALARGAHAGHLTYYDFGSAGHCPPYPGPAGGCARWGLKALGDISQKHRAVALPQIYHSFQARQWRNVRQSWDRRHSTRRHCSRHRSRRCFSFAGATSEPRACSAQLTPTRSWRHLLKENRNGSVGRELILYNPGRRNC